MRKTIFGPANSLDNFIARADGGMDWLRLSDEVIAIMQEMWKTIDAIVMGRKTHEATASMGSPPGFRGETYVCSRTLAALPDHPERTLVRGDAVDFVRGLRRQDGGDICISGGGELARSLLEAGLIDELHVNIHPLLLGSGVPMFHPLRRPIELDLVEVRPLPRGCVGLHYRVRP